MVHKGLFAKMNDWVVTLIIDNNEKIYVAVDTVYLIIVNSCLEWIIFCYPDGKGS